MFVIIYTLIDCFAHEERQGFVLKIIFMFTLFVVIKFMASFIKIGSIWIDFSQYDLTDSHQCEASTIQYVLFQFIFLF